jgi:Zn-dependent protease
VNIWLGLFNLLPIPPLDGSKIFAWNFIVWIGMLVMFFLAFIVIGGIA